MIILLYYLQKHTIIFEMQYFQCSVINRKSLSIGFQTLSDNNRLVPTNKITEKIRAILIRVSKTYYTAVDTFLQKLHHSYK